MTLQEIVSIFKNNGNFMLASLVVMSLLVEITPIKLNPWSWFANKIGRAFNGEVMKEIGILKAEMGQEIGTLKTEMTDVNTEVKGIKKDVSDIRDEAKEREATGRRTRILEFGDGLLHGVNYSKEHFDQILLDVTAYETYCSEHPNYMNSIAEATIKHIKKVYQQCLDHDGFL